MQLFFVDKLNILTRILNLLKIIDFVAVFVVPLSTNATKWTILRYFR